MMDPAAIQPFVDLISGGGGTLLLGWAAATAHNAYKRWRTLVGVQMALAKAQHADIEAEKEHRNTQIAHIGREETYMREIRDAVRAAVAS